MKINITDDLLNLLTLPEVIDSNTIVHDNDADEDINLCDFINQVRKSLGL